MENPCLQIVSEGCQPGTCLKWNQPSFYPGALPCKVILAWPSQVLSLPKTGPQTGKWPQCVPGAVWCAEGHCSLQKCAWIPGP